MNLDGLETVYNNAFWEAQSGVFRSYTIRFTFFDTYYPATGDPRTPWDEDPQYDFASASLQGYGRVPYTRQRKYVDKRDDIRLSSGWEMRPLEAEAKLRASSPDIQGALTLINGVRTRNLSEETGHPL